MPSDNRKWLYDKLSEKGVNVGTYDQFDKALEDEANLKWVYDKAGEKGLNVGGYDVFTKAMRSAPAASAPSAPGQPQNFYGEYSATKGFPTLGGTPMPVGETPATAEPQPVTEETAAQGPELEAPVETPAPDAAFADEYERRKAEYDKQTKGLRGMRGDTRGFDFDAYKAEGDWLAENKSRYEDVAREIGLRNLAEKKENLTRLEEKKKENQEHVARPVISTGGMAPGWDPEANKGLDMVESSKYDAANTLLSKAEQTYRQGSKYDPGYDKSWIGAVWTAARQFIGGGINNVDMDTVTAGLSGGSAMILARDAGEKSNAIVDDTLKGMGLSDEQAGAMLQSFTEQTAALSALSDELGQEAASIQAMEATYDDMVKGGASEKELRAYAEEYNKRVSDYNRRIKDEYTPALESYEAAAAEYEKITSTIDLALDGGLSDGDKALLDALNEYNEAQMKRAKDVSVAAKAGAGAEQSAEFMLDFIITGGLEGIGKKAATKFTARHMANKIRKDAAKKGFTNLGRITPTAAVKPSMAMTMLTDAGVAAARTAVMFPRNLQAYGEQLTQMTGKDELGRYRFDRSHLNAALNTALTQYIEYWSEGFGSYFSAVEQGVFRNVTKAAPRTAIGKTLGQYRGSIGKYLDYGKFDGQFNEMLEEVVGSLFNASAGWLSGDRIGDSGAMKDFVSGEQLATLFFSFLPMSTVSTITNIRAYNKMRGRYNDAVKGLNRFVESGALTQEDLDGFVSGISEKTPEELKDIVVALADKARKGNNGKLPRDFSKNLMAYAEGQFAMSLNSEQWEESREKAQVVGAYSGYYDNPYAGYAWDLDRAEEQAAAAMTEAGFSEDWLELDPYRIAQKAAAMRETDPEKADVLMQYASAKAAVSGLQEGYAEETKAMVSSYEDAVRQNAMAGDNVVRAQVQTQAGPVTVFVTSGDVSVGADGKITTPSGPDGRVSVRATAEGNAYTVKASDLSGATTESLDSYMSGAAQEIETARQKNFIEKRNTISPRGMSEELAQRLGSTVFVRDGNGVYEPVTITRMTNDGENVVISGDPRFLQGLATALGLQSPGGKQMEVPVTILYPALATEADGSLSTEQPEQAAPAQGAQQPAAPQQGADDLLGTTQTISIGGQNREVLVTDVSGNSVWYEYQDANGETKSASMPVAQFQQAVHQAQAPAAPEAPAAPAAPAETPAEEEAPAEEAQPQSKLPVTKKGEIDWDNMFNVDEATFAERIPELVQLMQQTFGENALKEVQKYYAAEGERIKKLQEKIDKSTSPATSAKLYKELAEAQALRKNYSTLYAAMTPAKEEAPAAPAPAAKPESAEPEAEGNVPDISDDTPEAAQKRGYVVQNGNRIDRSTPDAVVAEGKDTKIAFTKTDVVDGKYGLVEAARVVPSHISDQENPLHFFAKNWQPKDRKRSDSAVALQQMANNLRPEEITQGATAYGGAPVTNNRGEVIQGNGRSEALRRAYEQGTADGYKQWLADHAEEFGLTREQVEGMENPVLVRVLDVDDARAEELGKKEQKDLESGGDQTFNGKTLAKKLGADKLDEFLNVLLGGDLGSDATLNDYIDNNGSLALDWLHGQGFINDTEYQNAVTRTPGGDVKFTDATKSAFRDMCLEPLFANASEKVRLGYEKLPNNVKLALQRCAAMLSSLDGVMPDVQAAVAYFYDFETSDPAFQKAKTAEAAMAAIEDWMKNIRIETGKSEADVHPSEVARALAARFKVNARKGLEDLFKAIAAEMQGATDLFAQDATPVSREEAYRKVGLIKNETKEENGAEETDNNGRDDEGAGQPEQTGGQGRSGLPGGDSEAQREDAGDRGAEAGGAQAPESAGAEEGVDEAQPQEAESPEAPEVTEAEEESTGQTSEEGAQEAIDPELETPEGKEPGLLTEEQIRNSGYEDPSVIEQAVDYINGNTGNILNQVAYQTIEEYVRSLSGNSEQAGGTAGGAQLGAAAPANQGRGESGESGGELEQVDSGDGTQGVSGASGGVQSGGESTSPQSPAAPGEGGNTGVSEQGTPGLGGVSSRSGGRGRRGDNGKRGHELHDDKQGAGTGSRSDVKNPAGGNQARIEQLDSEIDDLLGQLKDTLSGFSTPDGTLSVSVVPGFTPEQLKKLAQAAKITAQIGFRLIQKGYYVLADYIAQLGAAISAVLKKAGINDADIDRFIRDSWDSFYTYNGETHRICEWATILKDEEFRKMQAMGYEEKRKLQKEANKRASEVKLGDIINIREQLPFLYQHQHDNVVKAEKQFFGEEAAKSHERAYGKGMMFTDGTGTGKTYTGLGIIKRFVNQGKGRILLVCPAGKVVDWQKDASNLGLSPESLKTSGKGSGFVVISYESFRKNKDLMEDTFDLVVYDEAHKMMSSVQAAETQALNAHFFITNRDEDMAMRRLQSTNELWKKEQELKNTIEYQDGRLAEGETDAQAIIDKCNGELKKIQELQEKALPKMREEAKEAAGKTKVLFLTATPFNSERNMLYADRYIFNSQGTAEQVKNRAEKNDGQFASSDGDFAYWLEKNFPAKFYVSGSDAKEKLGNAIKVDEQEIRWNEWAKAAGVLSGQKINIPFDYSRDFPQVSIEHQVDFNAALEDLRKNPQFTSIQQYFPHLVGKSGEGDYNWTSYLWEVMKASGLKSRIDEHLKMGRKVVIFNRRRYRPGEKVSRAELKRQGRSDEEIEEILAASEANRGLPPMGPPFAAGLDAAMLVPDARVHQAATLFASRYASLLKWEQTLDYRPIEEQFMDMYATDKDREKYNEEHEKWEKSVAVIRAENNKLPADKQKPYPTEPRLKASGIGLVRGTGDGVTDKSKLKDQETFNNTDKMNIIIVQEASGKEGISLHDTSGEHQRVLISTALPQSPLTFIQIEGRIYRLGNMSNAIYEYPVLGINLELRQFAGRISSASQTTENLAMGDEARGLRESIKNGILNRAGIVPLEGQGHGGKEFDQRAATDSMAKGFDGAIEEYNSTLPKLSDEEKNDPDMAITPHPLGYKMSQWANTSEGETFLEPGAGRGVLARYVPKTNSMTALETEGNLYTKLSVTLAAPNRTLHQKSIREYSVINKHDVVLMHPSVGENGIEALEQFIEAAQHLDEGGRIIAVLPQSLSLDSATINNDKNKIRFADGEEATWDEFRDDYKDVFDGAGGWVEAYVAAYVGGRASKSTTLEKMRAQYDLYESNQSTEQEGTERHYLLGRKKANIAQLIALLDHKGVDVVTPGSDSGAYAMLKTDADKAAFTKVMKGLVKVGEVKLPEFAIGGNVPMRVVVYDQVSRKETREKMPKAVSYDVSDAKDMPDFFEKIRDLDMPERTVDNMVSVEKAAKRFISNVSENKDLFANDGKENVIQDGVLWLNFKSVRDWDRDYLNRRVSGFNGNKLGDVFPFAAPGAEPGTPKLSVNHARRYLRIADRLNKSEDEYARLISKSGNPHPKAGAIRQFEEAYLKFFRDGSGLTETQIRRVADGLPADVSEADLEGELTFDKLKGKFDIANGKDDFRLKMFNKVLDKGEKSGLTLKHYTGYGNDAGLYYPDRHSLEINERSWNRLPNDVRASVICHEALHSATTLPLELNKRLDEYDFVSNDQFTAARDILNPRAKEACDKLENIYKAIMRGEESYKVQGYGLSNSHEMIAELANPDYRKALESRSLWKLPNGLFSGFEVPGAEKTNAYDEVVSAVDQLIDSFDAADYIRARNIITNRGGFASVFRDIENEQQVEDAEADNILFREETDADVLERLDSEPTIPAYRAMQFVPDPNGDWEFDLGDGKGMQRGFLYPPMSAKVDGKWRNPVRKDTWERSVEDPSRVQDEGPHKGQFYLDRGDEGGVWAAYNPYFHSSDSMLNDQFKKAQSRDNLVVVEVMVPAREVAENNMNPYRAEKAQKSVGKHEWKAGAVQSQLTGTRNVYLSRWDKPHRIVPVDEVARNVEQQIRGQVKEMPSNVVWPQLRAELEKMGVNFVETDNKGNFTDGERKGQNYESVYSAKNRLSKDELKALEKSRKNERAQREAARRGILEAEYRTTVNTLDKMSKEMGIKINRVGRDEMPRGHKSDKGYYDPKTGEMTICMENVMDERDAIATVLHETVGHHGLRKLFGDRFREAMARIYSALDAKGRTWVNAYIANHPGADNIRAVEEYLSYLAESGDFKSSVWQRIKEVFGRIVDAILGTKDFTLTDRELQYILRASYENLKNPGWLNTIEGKAADTLLKRESGVNETGPRRNTDPGAGEAGVLFREGTAKEEYEDEMKDWRNAAVMENQNADLPVKIGMEKIMKETGKDSVSEDEDYLTRHNLSGSRAETEATEFKLFHFKPMLEQIRAIQTALLGRKGSKEERQDAYQRVLDYLYAVSGLERNRYKNDEVEEAKQEALSKAKTAEEAVKIEEEYESRKRDWSGISSLMGVPAADWRDAEVAAEDMIDEFRRAVDNDSMLDELWDRIRSCTDFSLEHAYRHGLLTRDEYERLHGTASTPRMWEYYLPLRGFSEETAEEAYGYASMANPSNESIVVRKMNGRWTQADNPIANILNIAQMEIVQGNENWAKQALYRFVLDAGKNSLLSVREPWYVKNEATGKWSLAYPSEYETIEEFEERMKALRDNIQPDGSKGKPLAKQGRVGLSLDKIMTNKSHRNEHAIHLKVGGMDRLIWVNGNPAIAKAVSNVGRAQNMQLIRRASRALSNLFTTYSLDFTARNLFRDTIYSRMALIAKENNAYRSQFRKNWRSNFGYGAFAYPMVRMMAQWENGTLQKKANPTKKEQMFIDFMRDGGQTGYTIINSVRDIKKDLERAMRTGRELGSVQIPILGHYVRLVKTINEGFELLTRFTAYETSRDMGRSGQRSASDAKEISVNFNRKGLQSGKGVWGGIAAYLGATHYFYNAGVQGFDNFLHLFKAAPFKMTAGTGAFVLMGMLTPLMNAALAGLVAGDGGDDDPDWYWDLPEWVRRNNFVLGTGRWYLSIPLPVELRAFNGLGDIAASLMFEKVADRQGWAVGLDALNTLMSVAPVNPVEGFTSSSRNPGDALLRAVAPDAGMFFVDWATNRDYTGRPLWKENPFNDTVPRVQSAYASTPKALVAACQKLGETTGIDIAPGLVRDFARNYGGGVWTAIEDALKLTITDIEHPFRYDNFPFLSGFTGHIDEDRLNSFETNALYDYADNSERVVKRLNIRSGSKDITMEQAYDHPETLPQTARVQRILEGEKYILGKMYREGMNNEYVMKQYVRGEKAGQWYKSRGLKRKGVNTLKNDWKKLRDEWAAMPEGDEKDAFSQQVQDAWHLYCDAEAALLDRLMEEEYHHVQRKLENGIPYEPKPSLSERIYKAVK